MRNHAPRHPLTPNACRSSSVSANVSKINRIVPSAVDLLRDRSSVTPSTHYFSSTCLITVIRSLQLSTLSLSLPGPPTPCFETECRDFSFAFTKLADLTLCRRRSLLPVSMHDARESFTLTDDFEIVFLIGAQAITTQICKTVPSR
jgi:hypothetical protein